MRSFCIACLLCIACGDDTSPPQDGDVRIESGPLDGGSPEDLDGDGVCNETEVMRGTDPLDADTDGDGLPDGVEILLGLDPSAGDSPDSATVHFLRETPTAGVQVAIERDVFGNGEDYAGAFEATTGPDDGGQTAASFYLGSVAAYAVPAENVAVLDESMETMRGVDGRTLLGFEVRFSYGAALTRSCARAYPFRYNIKRSDGALVGVVGGTLVVLPPIVSLRNAPWCARSGCF